MGLSDFSFSLAMRDTITKMIENTVDSMRPGPRYGIVDTIDRANRQCGVILNGDTDAVLVPMGSLQPMKTGQTVRVAGPKGDRYIEDVMGPVYVDNARDKWISRGQFMLSHGGTKKITVTQVGWSGRFLLIGLGSNNDLAGFQDANAFLEIDYPAQGVVIPKFSNKIVGDGLDYNNVANADSSYTVGPTLISLGIWETLWYIPPWGVAASASVDANFRVTQYINSEYTIPSDWIMIASRNGDNGVVKWGDGQYLDYTHSFSYLNQYGDYSDSAYGPPGYRKKEELVYFNGLISGSANASFTWGQLPVGYRPGNHMIFTLNSSSGAREMRVNTDGTMFFVSALASNGWCSLDGVFFRAVP